MSERPCRILDFHGTPVSILVSPPPHVVFLGSKISSMPDNEGVKGLSRAGGLAALCVVKVGSEDIVLEGGKLPRDVDGLEKLGEGFVMAIYDQIGGDFNLIAEFFQVILGEYQEVAANPT